MAFTHDFFGKYRNSQLEQLYNKEYTEDDMVRFILKNVQIDILIGYSLEEILKHFTHLPESERLEWYNVISKEFQKLNKNYDGSIQNPWKEKLRITLINLRNGKII
jgi:hypothetical protein